ncbi:interferon alpha/beta receptor 2 isoform X1 [Scophthalmus maximus]|uniref:interferon alpha/beta receptor 2 isoform X1 n=1 Tax=Scophthalmus maximus TaxID=52904 RepID=UPI001FA8256A|nr:interferon alpha/beta receptor 2 isoform X1 [Scophthalmus maximus]XP_035460276.2 interferon alpha/beta receptor 2 isoform X1 [Scophthalmus maximus]
MTALIWMLTLLPQVLSAMNELPPPVNPTVIPSHFSHILKWQPGPGTPAGVHYHVAITTTKGTSWVPVAGCEHVQYPLVCNLTGAFYNPREFYFAQVITMQEGQASEPLIHPAFIPIKDTQLDLPVLTVTPCGRDLCVDLHPPMEHRREIYDTLSYKLKIKSNNADRAMFFKAIKSLGTQILEDLAPGRQYCVSVCITDSLESKESNYSQPVCVFTSSIYTADQWLSAVFCSLLMLGVVVVALLVFTGFICLKRRPLPLVLTSIHHEDGVLVIAPCSMSLSSLFNVEPILPSSGEKRSNQSADESEGESVTTDGCRGEYELRVGTNLLSSPSSSSLSAFFSEPQPNFSSNQTSDFSPQSEVSLSKETHSSAGLNHTMSTDTDSLTVGIIETDKVEKEVVGHMDNQDVNLLTLTFGRHREEREELESNIDLAELEPESQSASEEYNITPTQLSWCTKKVAIEKVSCSGDEEEEEEHSGYMGHPSTDFLI